jgi:Holliday junction resolvase RusA-like endonuclease
MSSMETSPSPDLRDATLNWTPRAKQRPRTTIRNGKAVTFTPKETRDAEAALATQWPHPPFDGPIDVRVIMNDTTIRLEVSGAPDRTSKKLRGDIDNYAKTILDALNGVAWVDDKQIVRLSVEML